MTTNLGHMNNFNNLLKKTHNAFLVFLKLNPKKYRYNLYMTTIADVLFLVTFIIYLN